MVLLKIISKLSISSQNILREKLVGYSSSRYLVLLKIISKLSMSSQNILREKLFGYFSTFLLKTFSKNVVALDLFSMLAVFEFTDIVSLSLMLLVPNLANTKWWKIPWKWLKPWHMGTHLRVLSESYPMITNMTGFRCFSKLFAFLSFEWK